MLVYAAGMDIGHSTVTTTCVLVMNEDGQYEVRNLNITDRHDTFIYSQIKITFLHMKEIKKRFNPPHNRNFLTFAELEQIEKAAGTDFEIGNSMPNSINDGEIFRYYKASPEHFNGSCGNKEETKKYGITRSIVLSCFFYTLWRNIKRYNNGKDFDQSTKILVGCPASKEWTSNEGKEKYAELVSAATGVSRENVKIVTESRASMFNAARTADIRISEGVAVFDFGSSTADFTYMLLGQKCLEFSWKLGAAYIEGFMAEECLKRLCQEEQIEVPTLSDDEKDASMNRMREKKEEYYNHKYDDGSDTITFSKRIDNKGYTHSVDDPDEFMKTVTTQYPFSINCGNGQARNESYRDAVRELYEHGKSLINEASYTDNGENKKCPLKAVVLTGGPAKMPFIKELCREVFGNEVNIFLSETPHDSVSQGLGYVWIAENARGAAVKRALEELKTSVNDMINKPKEDDENDNISESINSLYMSIAEQMCTKKIKPVIEAKSDEWQAGDELKTINDLMESILASEFDFSDIIDQEITKWKNSLPEKLRSNLAEAVINAVNNQITEVFGEKITGALLIPQDAMNNNTDIGKVEIRIKLTRVMDAAINQRIKNLLAETDGFVDWWLTIIWESIVDILRAPFGMFNPRKYKRSRQTREEIVKALKENLNNNPEKLSEPTCKALKDALPIPDLVEAMLKPALEHMLDVVMLDYPKPDEDDTPSGAETKQ